MYRHKKLVSTATHGVGGMQLLRDDLLPRLLLVLHPEPLLLLLVDGKASNQRKRDRIPQSMYMYITLAF